MNRRALNPDYLLLIVTYMLVAVGIFMVFDSSYARAGEAERLGRDSFFYLKRQAMAAVIGLVLMQWVSRISYWKFRRYATVALVISFILLLLCWVPGIGVVFAGAHRWIKIPVFGTLQSSEVAKLGLILFMAHFGAMQRHRIRTWGGLLPPLFAIGLLSGMVVVEPDMGTALVMVGIGVALLMASGARASHMGLIFGVLVVLAVIAILAEPYRMGRVIAFTDPWKHYNGSGYQIVHSLVALGSGGLFGKGLAQGVQKFFYLPAGHTDFIYATIGEELGLLGSWFVLALFFIFVYRGLAIAHKTKDAFGMLVAVGISAMVGCQALLNIAVVTSSVPATGVPLPFMSFGGSSLILMLVSVGVLVNISKYPDSVEAGEGEKARDESRVVGRGNRWAYLSGPKYGGSPAPERRRTVVHR